jgi:O-acetyl-ADP-ribose deacetylase (regulator of RNase III)
MEAGWRERSPESATWVREHGAVTHATPAYTSGGDLPSNYVIHAVGPVWGSGEEDEKLAAAVTGSLRLADKLDVRTLALPAISTGIFGFPKARAAGVILGAIEDYFIENENSGIDAVRLMLFDEMAWSAFDTEWERRFRG